MKNILNVYIKRPLLYDLLLCVLLILVINAFKPTDILVTQENATSAFSDIISTSVSLAGFILAALTIIVTFKDNISHKEKYSEGQNKGEEPSGLELLFNSKHYKRIVGVFSWAAFIFIMLFLVFSILKLLISKIPACAYLEIVIAGIVLIFTSIFRSLLILYNVIKLQIAK